MELVRLPIDRQFRAVERELDFEEESGISRPATAASTKSKSTKAAAGIGLPPAGNVI